MKNNLKECEIYYQLGKDCAAEVLGLRKNGWDFIETESNGEVAVLMPEFEHVIITLYAGYAAVVKKKGNIQKEAELLSRDDYELAKELLKTYLGLRGKSLLYEQNRLRRKAAELIKKRWWIINMLGSAAARASETENTNGGY